MIENYLNMDSQKSKAMLLECGSVRKVIEKYGK